MTECISEGFHSRFLENVKLSLEKYLFSKKAVLAYADMKKSAKKAKNSVYVQNVTQKCVNYDNKTKKKLQQNSKN